MKNHIALKFTPATESKWIIRDGVSNVAVGTITFEGIMSDSFCEIHSFGPFNSGEQTGSAWSYGTTDFRQWMHQVLHDLFGAKQAVVREKDGQSIDAITFFEGRVV